MSEAPNIAGLREAHVLIRAQHTALMVELQKTKSRWFGRLSRRHFQIQGASDALYELSCKIFDRIVAENESDRICDLLKQAEQK